MSKAKHYYSYSALLSQIHNRYTQLIRRQEIIKQYSYVMLIIDILLGLVAGGIIWQWPHTFFDHIREAYLYFNETMLHNVVAWLMGSPAGFQMNHNLAQFVGTIAIIVSDYWNIFISFVFTSHKELYFDIETYVAFLLAITASCGASLLLAIIVDIVTFVSFHMFFIYVGVTRLWAMLTSCLYSLILLFRGKKYNVLKQRIDSHDYDLDQLLLGTFFLCIFAFLFPTIFMFYTCFLLLWIAILFSQAALWFLIVIFDYKITYVRRIKFRASLPRNWYRYSIIWGTPLLRWCF